MGADNRPRQEGATEGYGSESPHEEDSGSSVFPYEWFPWEGGWGMRWPPGDEEAVKEESAGETYDEDETWWEEGLFTLLIVAGAILLVFPEPATSMAGAVMILAGVIGWVVDALR